ncbi:MULTISPECIES: hypothetical protein [unclassified Plantibacter]|uniref:hypothetical protein n=1 Tax=unclassified Plantibacter TaxID=2624265 RepID=UPI003D328F48
MTWIDVLLHPVVIAALITAVLSGGVLPRLLTALWRGLTGRAADQRSEVERLRRRNTELEDDLDREAALRRRTQEVLSRTRRAAFERGIHSGDLPKVPARLREQEHHDHR